MKRTTADEIYGTIVRGRGHLFGMGGILNSPRPARRAQPRALARRHHWQFLELPSGAFNDLEEFTIEGWVKWMDDHQWSRFFDFGNERSRVYVAHRSSSPDLTLSISPMAGGDNNTDWVASDLFLTNQWIHVAAVIARDRAQFYVNGALAASAPNKTPFNRLQRGERNRLGRDNLKDNVSSYMIDTKAFKDEFPVWRGARTGDQIREILFRRLTGTEPDLVCLLNFENQTPADKSPRANATKLVDNARIVPAPLPSPGELIPMTSFSGRVSVGAGNPAAGVKVRIEHDQKRVAAARTDSSGAYEIGFKYAPGTYDLYAQLNQFAEHRRVEIAPGKMVANMNLRLPPSKKGLWEVFNTARGLADDNEIRKILIEPDGSIWFATQGGASRFDGHGFVNFTTEDGLPENTVLNMARDSRGNIWSPRSVALPGMTESASINGWALKWPTSEALTPSMRHRTERCGSGPAPLFSLLMARSFPISREPTGHRAELEKWRAMERESSGWQAM
ncbi:MAG: hypothetical protein EXS36_13070 [Pedosphaera sp.]|nr:hypothetical protein [Pedosphaera sp.]